jgi:hypothetical protein
MYLRLQVAPGHPVVEVRLDLLDLEALPDQVDGQPGLDAEPAGQRLRH